MNYSNNPYRSSTPKRLVQQRIVVWLLRICTLISVFTTVGIVVTLVLESLNFFLEVPLSEFLFGTQWTPLARDPEYRSFGVLPLITGTLLVSVIAGGIALSFGLSSAIFLSEYAQPWLRKLLKPILEVLAGIPTVVYGYFALLLVTPALKFIFGDENVVIFNAMSAGLVMGIMIMPMVATLSEDAMFSVPRSLKDASYALGATKFETARWVILPSAASGIVSSLVLAISRAVGETMIVTIAAGAKPTIAFNPFESIQTMTAYIVQVSQGETPRGTLEYNTLFAVGLLLFTITLILNLIGKFLVRRFRQVY